MKKLKKKVSNNRICKMNKWKIILIKRIYRQWDNNHKVINNKNKKMVNNNSNNLMMEWERRMKK